VPAQSTLVSAGDTVKVERNRGSQRCRASLAMRNGAQPLDAAIERVATIVQEEA
jgi:hypothetical protein